MKVMKYDDVIGVRIENKINRLLERESIDRQISKGGIIRELLRKHFKYLQAL